MNTKKFIKKKNKIIKKVTGRTMVPKDQIVNIPKQKLSEDYYSSKGLTDLICPYCRLYFSNECVDCPMHEAKNDCITNQYSTYRMIQPLWREKAKNKDILKLQKLTIKYNKD